MSDIVEAIELHSVEGIKKCLSDGVDVNATFNGEPLIYELTSEYTRSPRFKACLRAFVDSGLKFDDTILLAVLLDDASTLHAQLTQTPGAISKKYTLRCAYTPLYEVTLLHICAEFNHVACADILVRHGMDVNAKAGTDQIGFGAQTAIFHTVNQNGNQSAEMMDFLISKGADLTTTVKGFIWGKGYPWETLIPAANPISYAMMGMLPQMHRDEKVISRVVSKLMKHAHGIEYVPENIPNAYLKK